MSFILDALKKLEHKRQCRSVPNLLTVHDLTSERLKKRSLWIYLPMVAFLINASILLIWLHPWRSEKPSVEYYRYSAPLTDVQRHESSREVNVIPEDKPVQSKVDEHKTVTGEQASPFNTKKGYGATQPLQENTSAINHPSTESLPVGSTSEQRILERNELPVSIQQELPDISIAGHIYSNDSLSRIVNINGKIVREGETITAGLKLEEITEYGVILSYQGYRFRMRGF